MSTVYTTLTQLLAHDGNFFSISGRRAWVDDAGLSYLNPDLPFDLESKLFVARLLKSAVTFDQGRSQGDKSLRMILRYWLETNMGQKEIVEIGTSLLQEQNLVSTLFPYGINSDVDPLIIALNRLQQLPTDTIAAPSPLPIPRFMPFERNRDFVGREKELLLISSAIKLGIGSVVAAGIGGVGKTQLAVEWVHRYGQYFAGGVFWLDFQDHESAFLSVAKAGETYGWNEYSGLDISDQVEWVKQQWNKPLPTLLVFDNCDDIELAQSYTEAGSGTRVLITSRNFTLNQKGRAKGYQQVAVTTLPRIDSTKFLRSLVPSLSVQASGTIAELLGDLPLALHVAGSYLAEYEQTPFGVPDHYIEQLQQNLIGELEENVQWWQEELPTRHIHSVRATFLISLARLRAQADDISTLAETLLVFLSHFAPGVGIPDRWAFKALPVGIDERLGVKALKTLLSIGLVETPYLGEIQLHRLVAQVVLATAHLEVRAELGLLGERVLQEIAPSFGQPDFTSQMEVWLPHARHISRRACLRRDEQSAKLSNELGLRLYYLAIYPEATERFKDALSIRRKVLGQNHAETATSLNNLAYLYKSQGNYKASLPLYDAALSIRRKVLGQKHAETATSLNNLAALHIAQGYYNQAHPLLEEALSINRDVLGSCHATTATSLNNLATLYRVQGMYKESLPLFIEALSICRSILGNFHPDTAQSLNNLADLYKSQGDYDLALPLYEEALRITESVSGIRHPETATCIHSLAELHKFRGEKSRALELYKSALSIRGEVFGQGHPSTAATRQGLADLYIRSTNYKQALEFCTEALSVRYKVLGERHPETAESLYTLGECHKFRGDYKTGFRLLTLALEIRRETLPIIHPDIAKSLNGVALIYISYGAYDKALHLLKEAVEISRQSLGMRHIDTAQYLNNLATIYKLEGCYSNAVPLYEEVAIICSDRFGVSHPQTTKTLGTLEQCRRKSVTPS